MSKITEQDVLKWPEVGQTHNDDWGVDDVRAKKINGKWAYVQLEWRYRSMTVGFILYDGKVLEELTELSVPKPNATLSNLEGRDGG